jgi:hypothetical protein
MPKIDEGILYPHMHTDTTCRGDGSVGPLRPEDV